MQLPPLPRLIMRKRPIRATLASVRTSTKALIVKDKLFKTTHSNFQYSSYSAGTVKGPVSDLKIHAIGNREYAFAVSGKATPSGRLVNPTKAEKPHTSGRLYNSMFVRHWDHYVTENRNSIFLAKLCENDDGNFELRHMKNALKGTG